MSKDKEISGVNEPKKVGKNLGCLHFKIFLPDYFLLLEINENCDTDTDNIDDIYFLEKLDLISRSSKWVNIMWFFFVIDLVVYTFLIIV